MYIYMHIRVSEGGREREREREREGKGVYNCVLVTQICKGEERRGRRKKKERHNSILKAFEYSIPH